MAMMFPTSTPLRFTGDPSSTPLTDSMSRVWYSTFLTSSLLPTRANNTTASMPEATRRKIPRRAFSALLTSMSSYPRYDRKEKKISSVLQGKRDFLSGPGLGRGLARQEVLHLLVPDG